MDNFDIDVKVHTEQYWRCEELNDFCRVWNLFEGMWRIDKIKNIVNQN